MVVAFLHLSLYIVYVKRTSTLQKESIMKRIAIISMVITSVIYGYSCKVNAKTTKVLREKAIPMATTNAQEGVCVGGDMEGLACL